MILYQIKNWNDFFENSKSREYDRCSYCCIPNKQDGLGYSTLLSLASGMAIYAAFVAVVLSCSKQRKPRHGFLTDSGEKNGNPLTAADLSRKTRIGAAVIQKMLDATSDKSIGWMDKFEVEIPDCPPTARELPLECPHGGLERAERKKEQKERKGDLVFVFPERLNSDSFKPIWEKWIAHRRHFKKPASGWGSLFAEQLAWLGTFDESKATALINASVRNAWQGLFEPNQNGGAAAHKPKRIAR